MSSLVATEFMLRTAEAAKRCNMPSGQAFRRWARANRIRPVRGARGYYDVAEIRAALERSRRRSEHAA